MKKHEPQIIDLSDQADRDRLATRNAQALRDLAREIEKDHAYSTIALQVITGHGPEPKLAGFSAVLGHHARMLADQLKEVMAGLYRQADNYERQYGRVPYLKAGSTITCEECKTLLVEVKVTRYPGEKLRDGDIAYHNGYSDQYDKNGRCGCPRCGCTQVTAYIPSEAVVAADAERTTPH